MDRYRIEPGTRVRLADHDPDDTAGFDGDKRDGKERCEEIVERLDALQELMYAEGKHRLLVVLQAMDAGGKDGTIRSVIGGLNPQGVKVHGFKKPTSVELAHDYLWRVHPKVPGNGEIAVFNRSHYEDVLVVRVRGLVPEAQWRRRFSHIVEFERLLADEGTLIRKFFLNISKDEQRERLQERIDIPRKRWKFNAGDLEERKLWDDYQHAYEEMLEQTSTEWAPWYVVPANRNWFRNLTVATVLEEALEGLDMRYPEPADGIEGRQVE